MTYVIAYIDEIKDERDNFFNDAFDYDPDLKVILIDPGNFPNLKELIGRLNQISVDAIISDFKLTENANINYSGEQIVNHMSEYRNKFPCFIMTSYEENAIMESSDVNMVYSKGDGISEKFFNRVISQIKHYQTQINSWENELLELLKIPINERTAKDNELIIELDHYLEKSLYGKSTVPKEVKKDIINGTQRLNYLAEMEQIIIDSRKILDGMQNG